MHKCGAESPFQMVQMCGAAGGEIHTANQGMTSHILYLFFAMQLAVTELLVSHDGAVFAFTHAQCTSNNTLWLLLYIWSQADLL